MEAPSKYRDRVIYALLLGAALVLAWANARRAEPNVFDRGLMAVVGPITSGATAVRDGVASTFDGYFALRGAHEEAEVLRTRVSELEAEALELRLDAEEANRLRALLGLRETIATDVVAARIVARERTGTWQVVRVRIGAGEADGIGPGMPVVAAGGLVGTVSNVHGAEAEVTLLTDPASSIDVLVGESRAGGTLRGGGIESRYLARVDYVSRAAPVAPGDKVVTSGLGATLPKGLNVGTVVHAEAATDSLFYDVSVEPAVDIVTVEEVLVIRSEPVADAVAGAIRSLMGGAGAGSGVPALTVPGAPALVRPRPGSSEDKATP